MNSHTHCLRSLCAFLAALVLAACLACPALADAPLVRDEYGLFDADTLAQLESSAEDASAGHDCDVYFLTVDSIGDTDQRAYAKNYYVQNDLGSGNGKSGILFMIALGSRKYVTIADGAQTYINLCASTLDFYAENGEPLDYDNDPDGGLGLIGILIVVGIPMLIAAVVCGILYSRMKTAQLKTEADDYIGAGLKLRVKTDRYTHTDRVEVYDPPQPESDSGGSTTDSDGFGGSSGGSF